jgi:hypothetical protein
MDRTIVFLTRAFVVFIWVLALHYAMQAQIVDNPSKTGVQQESIYRALDFISTNMDASCAATLPMAKEMIAALESDRVNEQTILIGHADFTHLDAAAFTGSTKDTPAGYLILIANKGAFFTADERTVPAPSPSSGLGMTLGGDTTLSNLIAHQYKGGTNQAKVVILLHEIGHATSAPGFVPDYGDQSKVDHNDSLVTNGCNKIVKFAGKFKGVL